MEEMNCQRIKEYLYQFIDGQLDTINSMYVEIGGKPFDRISTDIVFREMM